MKTNCIGTLLLIFFLLLGSCEEEKNDSPVIYTGKVTDITHRGATLNGRVIMPEMNDNVKIGFCWSKNSDPVSDKDYKIIIDNIDRDGFFSHSLDYALISSMTYKVRAYIEYNDIILYGSAVTFKSMGTSSPVINDVIPGEAWWTDTINIKGLHFSPKLSDIKVYFDNREVRIIDCGPENIFVEVPLFISPSPVPVKISVLGNEISDSLRFSIIPPEIHETEPQEGNFGEIVTIKGRSFINRKISTNISGITISHSTEFFYADVVLDVNTLNDTLATIIMPHNIPEGEHAIKAKNGSSYNKGMTNYVNHKFSITDFSPDTAEFGDTITIYGSFYSGPSAATRISVGHWSNRASKILTVTDSLISFILPGLYLEDENTINLTQKSAGTSSDKKLSINPPEIKTIEPLQGIPGDTVIITADNFHPDTKQNEFYFGSVKAVICYHSADTIKVVVPMLESSISEIRYIIKYLRDEVIADFEVLMPRIINVSHDTIRLGDRIVIEAENIPPDPSKLTVWLGFPFSPPQQEPVNNTFYVDIPYKPTIHGDCDLILSHGKLTDTWPVFSVCPFIDLRAKSMEGSVTAWSINDKILVYGYYAGGTYYREYNITGNYWSSISSYSFLRDILLFHPASFTIDSITYLGGGANNDRSSFNDILYRVNNSSYDSINQPPGPARRNASSFVINDRGYFGSGYDPEGNELADFWSYDPSGNEWTEIADFPTGGITSTFGNGNYGYALCTDGRFFRYNPSIDSWEEQVPIPGYSLNMYGFGIDDKIYVAVQSGDYVQIYAYDLLTGNWVKKNKLLMTDMKFAIDYDSEIYIHGHYFNFFKYDPQKDL
ncbi:MAG: IPT/TIG domain-containing protein [Bacteroidales bacterium]